MQKLASTKFVRNVVRSFTKDIDTVSWSDKCVSKKHNVENLRNVTLRVWNSKQELATLKANVEFALFAAGFTNKVKVTTSKYESLNRSGGYTYIRINKCVLVD